MKLRKQWWLIVFLIYFILLGARGDSFQLNEVNRFEFYLDEPVAENVVRLIQEADESIVMGMYYYMTPRALAVNEVTEALVAAKERGVEVEVGLEGREDVEGWSQDAYEKLKEAEIEVRYYEDEAIQHIKAIVVDSRYVFVGSQNISYSALVGENWESGVMFESKKIAKKLRRYLEGQK